MGNSVRFGPAAFSIVLSTLALVACTGAPAPADVPGEEVSTSDAPITDTADIAPADGVTLCTRDSDCTDSLFCNGAERCMPGHASADARGCIGPATPSPCLSTQRCEETQARCVTNCSHEPDADGDGHVASDCGGDDCDDSDPRRFPGNPEVCDTMDHDEDCDAATFGVRDGDSDGYPDARCCNGTGMARHCGDDCDDARSVVHPGAPETCDTFDNDCNGTVDDGVMLHLFADADHDGYGDPSTPMTVSGCMTPSGAVANSLDCDDTLAARNPAAPEVCDGLDNDCDSMVDDGAQRTFYADADRDGFGSPATTMNGCSPSAGFVDNALDCDDTTNRRSPAFPEVCDGIDNDCDTMVDDGAMRSFYPDRDGDFFGDMRGTAMVGCMAPAGYVENNLDCDDTVWANRPGAIEQCDNADNNCNGMIDEGAASSCTPVPNTTFACTAGRCTVASCTGTFGNCDTSDANGCESNLSSDANHCGTCTRTCGVGGVCTATVCDAPVGISVGGDHVCVRRSSGSVACWGENASGQLGDGTRTPRSRPVLVAGLLGATSISAGGAEANYATPPGGHTCAVAGSRMYCWGANSSGQLGIGTLLDALTPQNVQPPGDSYPVSFIGTGHLQSCLVTHQTGSPTYDNLYCAGDNSSGQLGTSMVTGSTTPFRSGINVVRNDLAIGWSHSCGLDGTRAYCWGANGSGQLGIGTTVNASSPTPVCTTGSGGTCVPADFSTLAAGNSHTCGRRGDGTIWCWGNNGDGQLGNGRTSSVTNPVQASGITTGTAVAAGAFHSCALLANGTVRCWGQNVYGQLGNGTNTGSTTPVSVTVMGGAPLDGVIAIGVGGLESCAVRNASPRVMCWGRNGSGQIGDGSTTDRNVATPVVDLGP